jgi:membrane protease YdiL (CAAX protease family)
MTAGKPGITTLLQRMVRWRVGLRWYLVALGLPIVMSGLASILTWWRGAPAPSAEQLAGWPELFILFPLFLLIPGLAGVWEEPGWRGYALHRLEQRFSRLWAMAPLWAIIVVWHLPLFILGNVEWPDVFNMIGGVIVYNWLYHRSGHSVLMVMLIHAMNNTVSGEFFSPMFTGVYSVQQAWMRVLVWSIVALLVLLFNWKWWTEPSSGEIDKVRPASVPV